MSITHINLPVVNLKESEKFYNEVLGFETVMFFTETDDPEDICKVVMNYNGFDFFLERSEENMAKKIPLFHIGLKVAPNEIDQFANRLLTHGVDIGEGPVENPPYSNTFRFYFEDPDGWIIEVYDAI